VENKIGAVRNLLDCRVILPLKDKRPTMTNNNIRFQLCWNLIGTCLSQEAKSTTTGALSNSAAVIKV
jgi:hypothetical protein